MKKVIFCLKNEKKSITIWGTGKPIREWLYVTDGAKSLIKSLELDEGLVNQMIMDAREKSFS